MNDEWDLPDGWEWACFRDVAEVASDLVDPAAYQHAAHIAPNHIESGTGRLLPFVTIEQDAVTSPKHRFRAGQILYSKIRPYLAKAVLIDFDGLCSADMYPVSAQIDTTYLHKWLISSTFTEWASRQQGRTVLPKINQEALAGISVPVPPLAEQRRIVATIEALQARSRKAREALLEVPALLEQFRQSVLAAAFRGDLTADWREQHPNLEPASVLLERIRQQRRRWEDANPQKKFTASDPIEDTDLPDLPDGWCWAMASELCQQVANGGTPPPNDMTQFAGEVPFIKVYNLTRDGSLDFSVNPTFVRREVHEGRLARSRAKPGDVLMNIVGPPLGKVSIVPDQYPEWNFNQAIVSFRVLTGFQNDYLALYLQTDQIEDWTRASSKATAGQFNISVNACRALPVPVAPELEQLEIVRRLHTKLAGRRRTLAEVIQSQTDLQSLDQSILAKAFRGELVPQDPNDEPASVLLDRIRAEREQATESPTKSNGRAPRRQKRKAT